jgi:ATP-dependent helicase HrpB
LENAARDGGLIRALEQQLSPEERRRLSEAAPERIRLPGGRQVRVHYEPGQPPWIASRLQDFFGMRETPRIGGKPLVIRLLAPNQRPVQTTTDLAGFWDRLYPELRRQLSRRYPKHSWPE